MTTYRPPQCTEREPDGEYEDCTWASSVMFANAAAGDEVHPSTQQEYEALRRASGDSMEGGSNLFDVERGMARRYHWSLDPRDGDWDQVRAAIMRPGWGWVLQGRMSAVGDHLRRWDPSFRGAHAVYGQCEDPTPRAWWMNPLAPKQYAGEWVSEATLRAFYEAQPGAHFIAIRIGSLGLPDTATEDAMAIYTRNALKGRFTIPAKTEVKGYRPVADGWEVAKTWPANSPASSAPFTAQLVRLSGTTVPSSLLLCSDGFFENLYVSTAEVTEVYDPVPDATALQRQLDVANGRIRSAITVLGGTP